MAGVTDRPFRDLCTSLGASMAVSEMVSATSLLSGNRKTLQRIDHSDDAHPRSVQIVGTEPQTMALAARRNVVHGAEIIDINMGCPAKKVCSKAAGSALMRDEALVDRILAAVVDAVDVPVTLKIRTGWDRQLRNAVAIAQIAQRRGIRALAVHGRTRADHFRGDAEYDTIREVKASVDIPVLANGDIRTPEQARLVLQFTGADGLMIGRSAQGNPWIFREVRHYLNTGTRLPRPDDHQVCTVLHRHLRNLYAFYGEPRGVRIARKHIGWYCRERADAAAFRARVFAAATASEQLRLVTAYFLAPAAPQSLAA